MHQSQSMKFTVKMSSDEATFRFFFLNFILEINLFYCLRIPVFRAHSHHLNFSLVSEILYADSSSIGYVQQLLSR